ncbi:hypothetical protein AAFF_G00398100 [Aldrovandia affinis]|uniref:Uncharacterized protein n=1 Tax=Aldrovandia affinis TaxID=143900 RepID=A0AAD7R3R6_9TELE|nr:hypothetical protein AAFF_G00398100 [Aldrovandia affinis]
MPFSLKNATQAFQHLMDSVLRDLTFLFLFQRSTHLNRADVFVSVPTSRHDLPQSRLPGNLRTAEFIFVRHDTHRGPLQPPYGGPFCILELGDKTFIIDIEGKPDHISMDQLKPTHRDLGRPVGLTQPPFILGGHVWQLSPLAARPPTRPGLSAEGSALLPVPA